MIATPANRPVVVFGTTNKPPAMDHEVGHEDQPGRHINQAPTQVPVSGTRMSGMRAARIIGSFM
jgi:hypothetical protein